MPRFAPDSRQISAQHPVAEFYREEFVKHHRCLQRQRAYYSESAITDVETALSKIMGQLDTLCTQADALTRAHAELRQDILAIVRAGIAAVDAEALTERALAAQPLRAAGEGG